MFLSGCHPELLKNYSLEKGAPGVVIFTFIASRDLRIGTLLQISQPANLLSFFYFLYYLVTKLACTAVSGVSHCWRVNPKFFYLNFCFVSYRDYL